MEQDLQLTPGVITYDAPMSACEKYRQPGHALALCKTMQGRQLTPDVISSKALMSTCERSQQPEKAFAVFETMQGQQLWEASERLWEESAGSKGIGSG